MSRLGLILKQERSLNNMDTIEKIAEQTDMLFAQIKEFMRNNKVYFDIIVENSKSINQRIDMIESLVKSLEQEADKHE